MLIPAPHPFVVFAGNVAPLTSILLTLSPLPTLLSIPRDNSEVSGSDDVDNDKVNLLPLSASVAKNPTSKVTISSLPLLPYSSMAVNGFLWTMYGLLLKAKPIVFPNVVGACLALSYIVLFAMKSSPSRDGRHIDLVQKASISTSLWARTDLPSTFRTHLTVGSSILMLGFTCYKGGLRNQLAALATLVCGVMFVSPLAKISSILKNKSCPPGAIPLPFTIATAANCFLWSVYGIKGVKGKFKAGTPQSGLFVVLTLA